MTPNVYQQLAMRTCNIPYDQKQDMMMHAVLGLTSEAGEVAGIFQKKYQGHTVDPEHLKEELGDCLWMIAEACTALGVNLQEVMQANIVKLKKRYPDGFDPQRSLHREEKALPRVTPIEFANRMNGVFIAHSDDPETLHRVMDEVMCEMLETLGYTEGVNIFSEAEKWYA